MQIKQTNTDKKVKEGIFVKVMFELKPSVSEEDSYVCMVKNIPGMENDNIELKKKGQDHDGVTPTSGWPEPVGDH